MHLVAFAELKHIGPALRRMVTRNMQAAKKDRWEGQMPSVARKRKHSAEEIATKLAQANELATQGKLQSEIARSLGVSIMTLHRWRKIPPKPQNALLATNEASRPESTRADDRIAELQLENSRLRRLVTDLLLDKMKLEDVAHTEKMKLEDAAHSKFAKR